MNATTVPAGPSQVPSAASSFTSPAPVPPKRCPGSISRSPSAAPVSAPAVDCSDTPTAAAASPARATVAVITFGMRPVRRSTAAAMPAAARMATSDTASEAGSSDDLPERAVDRVAECPHGTNRDDGDEANQQRVLEQVLSVLAMRQAHEPMHDQ